MRSARRCRSSASGFRSRFSTSRSAAPAQAARKFRVARTAGLASPGTSVPQHTEAAVRAMDVEGDRAFYARLVVDDEAVEEGLADVARSSSDTRLRDALRALASGDTLPPRAHADAGRGRRVRRRGAGDARARRLGQAHRARRAAPSGASTRLERSRLVRGPPAVSRIARGGRVPSGRSPRRALPMRSRPVDERDSERPSPSP